MKRLALLATTACVAPSLANSAYSPPRRQSGSTSTPAILTKIGNQKAIVVKGHATLAKIDDIMGFPAGAYCIETGCQSR